MRRGPSRPDRDRGQAAVAACAVVVVCLLLVVAVVRVAQTSIERAHAQAAADAAALAMVIGGDVAAREIAASNGAELVRWWWSDGDVVVEVSVGDVSARARATDQP